MTTHPAVESTGLRATRLASADLGALTDLCARCAPFFAMVHGSPDASHAASDMLASLPPGRSAREKHLFGFWHAASLVAALDLAQDYPASSAWYVAGFIVSPGARGLGLGKRLWEGAESWLAARGGTRIGLIVQRENPGARRFWEARGFTIAGETLQRLGDRENRVWSMTKDLQ